MKLLIAILTKNEAHHIVDCLSSVSWADQVLVMDSYSDDGTPELAAQRGALVRQKAFVDFASHRNATLDVAAELGAQWLFFLDADERATDALYREIDQAIRGGPEVGWWVPRHNYIVGQRVKYGGFYPDYQLRLLRIGRARYDPQRPVHEVVILDGPAGYLGNPLLHYNYDTWAQFNQKQRRYAAYEAGMLQDRRIQPRPHNFVLQPLREFRRRYLTLQGYRDGLLGLKLSALLAYYYGFYPYWLLVRGEG